MSRQKKVKLTKYKTKKGSVRAEFKYTLRRLQKSFKEVYGWLYYEWLIVQDEKTQLELMNIDKDEIINEAANDRYIKDFLGY